MESRYGWINQQASPHIPQSSNRTYFTEQARGAGYMGPEFARNQQEFYGNHHQPHPLHIPPQPLSHPHPHPPPQYHPISHPHPHPPPQHHPLSHPHLQPPPHPQHMREAVLREIEKERIREEIIREEITRRRELEAEVRRELMMESELALRRGGDGFPLGLSPQTGFQSPMRLAITGTRFDGKSLDERIAKSQGETKMLNGWREGGEFETLPFQRGSMDLRISEIKPVSGGAKKLILLAKPGENIAGSKRKAVTPPEATVSDPPADEILNKKAKEEWSCAICQVSATCEQGLIEHMRGKKHKSKEATLGTQRAGKNYTIGLLPKTATKSTQAVGNIATAESTPLLLKKNNQSELVQKQEKNNNPNKKKYNFWCEICKVGTLSQKVMNAHKKGKKHMSWLQRNDRNAALVNHEEQVGADAENIVSEKVDETLDEAKLEENEHVDAVEPEEHKVVDEAHEEDRTAVDIIAKAEDELTDDVVERPKTTN